jgi:hypothetical protein
MHGSKQWPRSNDVAILDLCLSVINEAGATRQIPRGLPETEILIFRSRGDEGWFAEAI